MADHRIRLSDREVQLIVAALRARAAALNGSKRGQETMRLYERLIEGKRGNPDWILGPPVAPPPGKNRRADAPVKGRASRGPKD